MASGGSIGYWALFLAVQVRLLGAAVNGIPDCDETYNYWEPLHYLMYGTGMQTWEYSPAFALRTYAYLVPHALVGHVAAAVGALLPFGGKPVAFYGIRAALALLSAWAEYRLAGGMAKKFGGKTGTYTLLFLVLCSGMFQASSALLPSSLAVSLVMLTWAHWLEGAQGKAVFWAVLCVLGTGWPFSAALFVFFALDVLVAQCRDKGAAGGLGQVLKYGLTAIAMVLPPTAALDFYMYRRLVYPNWNIFVYNVLGGGGGDGADLYGVEPASFYLHNLALNLNSVLVLFAVLPVVAALSWLAGADPRKMQAWALWMQFASFLWLGMMFSRPHKEERFLFPIYPLMCAGAGASLAMGEQLLMLLMRTLTKESPWGGRVVKAMVGLLLVLTAMCSAARVGSMVRNYSAPLHIGQHLYYEEDAKGLVCIGQEWYRFPSHFFLPEGSSLAFVPSHFKGQLPQPFRADNGTWAPPLQPFNDLNREEPSRYVPLSSCAFFMEHYPGLPESGEGAAAALVAAETARFQQLGSEATGWERVVVERMLDADRSPSPYRALYIPILTERKTQFSPYILYKKKI